MSYRPAPAHGVRTRIDVGLLQLSDRACLRLLEHSRVCTASQLASLIYPSVRTALRRTRKLWLNRLVTRESLPADRGGTPVAYRLSEFGRRRLHLNAYRSPGLVTLRHALDGVELVASLVRHDPGLVQLWLTESHIPDFANGVQPDQFLVIDTGEASALILVEVDESTERPPVIRERLEAYAKLFEDRRAGWHLLWVANSPERLARLRQIAGPMKRPTLAGRCWGVPIDEISELGADAEVVGVGANMEPRTLRGLVTDPTARLSDYPVGSPAWIQLLANGGREEINGPWEGVEREPVEAEPVEAEPVEASSVAATTEAKIAVVVEKSLADDQPGIAEAAPGHASRAVLPEPPAAQAEVDADIRLMHGGEFVRLILDAAGEGHRAARAVEFLAERNNTYYLFDELERLCHSGVPEQQLQALRVVRNLRPPEDEWYRQRARELLLRMVDQRNEPAVVKAALAALEARDHPARGVADSGT